MAIFAVEDSPTLKQSGTTLCVWDVRLFSRRVQLETPNRETRSDWRYGAFVGMLHVLFFTSLAAALWYVCQLVYASDGQEDFVVAIADASFSRGSGWYLVAALAGVLLVRPVRVVHAAVFEFAVGQCVAFFEERRGEERR